jgi:hypothetical protein
MKPRKIISSLAVLLTLGPFYACAGNSVGTPSASGEAVHRADLEAGRVVATAI